MPAQRLAAVGCIEDIHCASGQHREAESGAGVEIYRLNAACVAVLKFNEPRAAELADVACPAHKLLARVALLRHGNSLSCKTLFPVEPEPEMPIRRWPDRSDH